MNAIAVLTLVLLATFGLSTLSLSALVTLAWRAGLGRALTTSLDLLTLRLLPAAGGLLIAFTVVLPEFLRHEPAVEREAVGPLLLALSALGAGLLLHGLWRGGRACFAGRALLRSCGEARRLVVGKREINVVELAEPLAAVIGSWRPKIVLAGCIVSQCSGPELDVMIGHEGAHVLARDNLKQLLLISSPDVLAFTSLGEQLIDRWRAAAEREADQRATGCDPRKRVLLAGALLKVARAMSGSRGTRAALAMPVASDDIEGRVRQLLAPPDARSEGSKSAVIVVSCLLGLPLAAVPFYGALQELIEELVRIGL